MVKKIKYKVPCYALYLNKIWKDGSINRDAKVKLVKTFVFSIGAETWTLIKTSIAARRNSFEMWCWKKLIRTPWTAKRTNAIRLQELLGLIQRLTNMDVHSPGDEIFWRYCTQRAKVEVVNNGQTMVQRDLPQCWTDVIVTPWFY